MEEETRETTIASSPPESGCSWEDFLDKVRKWLGTVFTWKVLKPILFGQCLSLFICGTAITSTYLVDDYNANVPLTQSLSNYFLLALVYGNVMFLKKDSNGNRLLIQALRNHWWKYLLITVADVAANYLIVKAYQYTSLTSVQVLDCFVIFVVMLLSWFVLKVQYKIVHYIGVVIALLGVAFMIVADILLGKGGSGSKPLTGDLMVLAAATCYGVSNVGMEYVVKRRPVGNMEILSMFGIFGTALTSVLLVIFEREALTEVTWGTKTYLLFTGFAVCMFSLYSLMPLAMKMSSATTVNLSILTADLYALFAGLFLFDYKLSPLYFISFAVISLSLIIYNSQLPGVRGETEDNIDVARPEQSDNEEESIKVVNNAKTNSKSRLIEGEEMMAGTSFSREEV